TNIVLVERGAQQRRILCGCGYSLKLRESHHLLSRTARDEHGSERLHKGALGVPPSVSNKGQQSLTLLALVLIAPDQPSLHITTMQDEFADAVRVARGVGRCDRCPLRYTVEGKPIEPSAVDDRFQILNERRKGEAR